MPQTPPPYQAHVSAELLLYLLTLPTSVPSVLLPLEDEDQLMALQGGEEKSIVKTKSRRWLRV